MFLFGKKTVRGVVFILFFIFILFTISRYSPYIEGPRLGEGNFQHFINLVDNSYHLHVDVIHTKSAFLNGRELQLKVSDRDGSRRSIDEELFFHNPYDNAVIRLVDSFGHEKEYPFFVWVNSQIGKSE